MAYRVEILFAVSDLRKLVTVIAVERRTSAAD